MSDERLVDLARELEARDERLAREIAEVDELHRAADEVRLGAGRIAEFLDRLPLERAALDAGVGEAEVERESRARAHAEAQAELGRVEGSRDGERVAAARRAELRARDAAMMAGRKVERAVEARLELDRQAAASEREVPELERRARTLAARLGALPRISRAAAVEPAVGLAGAIDWGNRARAALFVVRGSLDTERERVVREANELAASALGEPASATSVALVRERLERAGV